MNKRFDRHMVFFGEEGQKKLSISHVVVVGAGGIGGHVIQQLALLGVGHITVIDNEELDDTNLNRYVTARHDDPIPGSSKVNLAERLINEINPAIQVKKLPDSFVSKEGFSAIIAAEYIFGCLDNEGSRLVLNELCAAYAKPYIDFASEIIPDDPPEYGGSICIAWDGKGCLVCCDQLDMAEAQIDLADPGERRNRNALYGIPAQALNRSGPSVVSINGVVASLGVTEFMLGCTGVRSPNIVMTYRGRSGRVTAPGEEEKMRYGKNCYYCEGIRGRKESHDIERYLRSANKSSI